MNRTLFRFADFQLDPAARELRQDGRRVALPPKSLECLIYLIEQRDRAVGRDELISAVWGRVDVSDALLAQTLLRARRAVGDTGNEQSSIRTVPRFGYQWVAPTQAVEAGAAPAEPAAVAVPPAAAMPSRRRARWPVLAAAALLGLAALVLLWHRAAETPAPAAADLIVVAPVALPGAGADAAWIRLGVMDYIAARLRGAGLVVLPSERVAGLVAERGGESPQELHRRLRRASGAGLLLQPEARLRSDGSWQLLLQPVAEQTGRTVSGRGASPLAAADAAVAELLPQLGRAPAAAAPASSDAAAERLQRLDAAMLEGDLAAARALIAAADPAARADPALQVREGQLAFRLGNLEATEAIFGALQANLGQLPPELQAQALSGLGALAVRRGQYAEAERRYAESLAVLGPDGRQDLIGNGFTGRGVARGAQGQHELAAADLARGRVALERAGDAPGVASVDTNLGLLQSRSGKPALALQSFERAITVFERYDVRDSLAASLLGLARTQQLLADNAAALDSARRAAELARLLENPVLLRNIAQQLADALIANGRLAEAAGVIDSLPAAPTPADGLTELRMRLALEQGRNAEALRLGAAAPATDATAQLLFVQAALAAGNAIEAATRNRIGTNLGALGGDDAAVHLARALWQDAAGDATGAAGHFAAALAKADADGDVSRRIEVLAAWIAALLRQGGTDRATELAGQIAPLIERDYRAARAAALYYRAVGDAHLQAAAEHSLRALAGERATGLP
ncbi:tetratricopeptide repeat protein [Tahibacter harae]|uniref:Tetratricopeptide repeat protein n=1 Tax=Tahibacter harae TaxID=2963937 RepID=A0ABT1QZ20_9GAMM|nr:tetratricopeptide repeat protein [Tahibacter harae]MCQ4167534.1 tetratricopeptide repeat protein [Tahibacter harae]